MERVQTYAQTNCNFSTMLEPATWASAGLHLLRAGRQPSPGGARSQESPSFVPVEKLSWAQYLAKWPWFEN